MTVFKNYLGGFSAILLTFSSFVACGTEMYKVSVAEDFDTKRSEAAHPASADKNSKLYGIHAPSGWVKLPVEFRFSPDMDQSQRIHLMAAMKKWEWAVGEKLFAYSGEHKGVVGDSFKDLYSSLQDDVNGHYLDQDWAKTNKPDHVLATTIWNNATDFSVISKADIRFNSQHYLIGDSYELKATTERDVVDMQSLALHELGHLLGLAHTGEDVDSLSIMNPALYIGEGLTSRKFSRGDLERIHFIYGCHGQSCDIDGLLKEQENADWDKLTLTAKRWMQDKGPSPELNFN
ncbi:hypothetical protein DAPPUDRAFT_343549 [Daphnia pulex]|uniref:Peptidase M10 metallopeptidase domain-containing protein n=1 Tax=Daphnia pulex TaxID=6669 RepID=E9I6A5_DAPPU|nr:hypothetical protein DAPPUDRAFT_343549 [Daphnia pulex]|eukprot:EFX60476.1 hypothetical protein DAPPUDRAFT_343549 [Daphnia pulex]